MYPCLSTRDLQTYGVPPLANAFCLLWGVNQQSHTGLISVCLLFRLKWERMRSFLFIYLFVLFCMHD